MATTTHEPCQLWSIILTGNERPHNREQIQAWLGHHKPTSFCTFVGSRSMLQHTWDRADQLSHPNCKITVVERSYLHETCTQLGGRVPGTLITEPRHQGMVVSLFLSLTYLQVKDPNSLIVVYPSDHFIYPEYPFLQTIQRGIWAAQRFTEHVLMIGVSPTDHPTMTSGETITVKQQLGWVYGIPIYTVEHLLPILESQAWEDEMTEPAKHFWNTSVLIAKTSVLWNLGWRYIPEMMTVFDELQDAIGTSYEQAVLEKIFQSPKLWNTQLLGLLQFSSHLAALELEKVFWSDWGQTSHIVENLCEIGKHPAFPLK